MSKKRTPAKDENERDTEIALFRSSLQGARFVKMINQGALYSHREWRGLSTVGGGSRGAL